MNLHEYQSKQLLKQFGIPVPESTIIRADEDVEHICDNLPRQAWIVKAQIHAGGRGKAGGVFYTKTFDKLVSSIRKLLGSHLVTHQTNPLGLPVNAVLVEESILAHREIYVGLLVDRASKKVSVIASAEGGTSIEEVAQTSPEKIFQQSIHPSVGIQPYNSRVLANHLQLNAKQQKEFHALLQNLYTLFLSTDAQLVEINPLVVGTEDSLVALDAKISLDDNALFRQKDLADLRDVSQENPIEAQASDLGLNYVKLDGQIGCIVNGAGLAMATMDLIQHFGGEPANFLDVGGNTDSTRVSAAFKLVLSDPKVKVIFVNIFGGIVRCDVIATGILAALEEIELEVPVVALLQGTNAERGKELLDGKISLITPVSDFAEGAQRAIELSRS